MDNILENEFAGITLLTGVAMIACGIIFRFFPPKKLHWYNSIPLNSAWQNNEVVQREAMRWTVRPSFTMGLFFTGLALLSLAYPASPLFTFTSAMFLAVVCCLAGIVLRERHLKRLFDEDDNLRKNA